MLQIEWVCRNVVATFDLGQALCLRTIALQSANCEYNPSRFTAAILRLRTPRVSVLLFASGKCVVAGGTGVHHALAGTTYVARHISAIISPCKVRNFIVRNMVYTTRMPFRLRIDALYEHLRSKKCFHRCFYDPICFPGIRCSLSAGKSPSLLIFATGRMVCTGLKRPDDVLEVGNLFMPFINAYRSSSV